MRVANQIVAVVLISVFLVPSLALAQEVRVVDATAMSQALASRAASETAQRELVRRVIDRAEVRQVASVMGLSVEQASSAVATLTGADLDTLAQHASAVDTALAGGANTIVISVTTLLLILIIVILLAK